MCAMPSSAGRAATGWSAAPPPSGPGAIAAEWSEAMRDSQSGVVRDFVAVGDVSVKVIGADGPVLDAAVPVRQLLEQLVAKTACRPSCSA